jgi:hypothetical protein
MTNKIKYKTEEKNLGITLHLPNMDYRLPDKYEEIELRNLVDGVIIIATSTEAFKRRMGKKDDKET